MTLGWRRSQGNFKRGAETLRHNLNLRLKTRSTRRYAQYMKLKQDIRENEGGLDTFAQSYKKFGLRRVDGGFQYTEYAPAAKKVSCATAARRVVTRSEVSA